jgi:hypothetical protein
MEDVERGKPRPRLVTVTQGRRRLVPADSITGYVQLLLAECRAGGNGHAA